MSKKISFSASAAMAAIILLSFSFSAQAKIDKTYQQNIDEKVQKGIRVEEFQNLISMNQNIVERRQEIEFFLNKAGKMPDYQSSVLSALIQEKYDRAAILNRDIAISITRDKKFNANNSEFKYLPHSDGSIVYFKAGQASRILNERAVDEFGNVSLKDTWDMKYNDRLLLTSYKSKTTDELGNVSFGEWQGTYTEDSVFYADDSTNANKNMLSYGLTETDHAGNTKTTEWEALEYSGKLVKKLKSEITDSVYGKTSYTRSNITYINKKKEQVSSYVEEGYTNQGLFYTLKRENMRYNKKDQVTGYEEEKIIYEEDGSVRETISTKASFAYLNVPFQFGRDMEEDPDPDRMLYSCITTDTTQADGSMREETTTTDYTYDKNRNLISAEGHSVFSGNESCWYKYTDQNGNALIKETGENGEVSYFYKDPQTGSLTPVDESEVISLQMAGDTYSGSSVSSYEIFKGKPMLSTTDTTSEFFDPESGQQTRTETSHVENTNGLVNNIRRLLSSNETGQTLWSETDIDGNHYKENQMINTEYIYEENGNLKDLQGTGSGYGTMLTDNGVFNYTSTIDIEYSIIQGEPKQEHFNEEREFQY